MGKLVVLKFGEGSFEQGFTVTLQIGEERYLPSTEISGKLPPSPEMPLHYSHWQSSYQKLSNRYRLYADNGQVTNVSMTQQCEHSAIILRAQINRWLEAEEFRSLREKWLERLSPSEEVRVIVQTENSQLQRLPWHLWDLLERYPKAELALSLATYDRIHKPRTPNPLVNILAIVGNSQGIDTEADQALLKKYNDNNLADVDFLVEPQRQKLTDHLWGKNWDILFFAGHSSSDENGEIGRIYLNKTDSLTISELKYALRKAIDRGLQLAIFNSCDGLGLARELADLQIPQIIIMREPVPDKVAQEFLKYFLQNFAGGETLYQAVKQARERLEGLEDKFPCATWLPVICQNLAQIPPTWEELREKKEIIPAPPPATKHPFKLALLSNLLITALVCGVRLLGLLHNGELKAFDQMMRSRPDEGLDPRLLIVKVDDQDLANQRLNGEYLKGTSLSDKSLNKLLAKLKENKPLAIGLDIYRDFSAEQVDLSSRLQQTQNLVGVCKGSDATANTKGIKPPPEIPKENLGFSDFIQDNDGVLRRHLMFMTQEPASLCSARYALSSQLALRYLAKEKIKPSFTPQGNLQLGKIILSSLDTRSGSYQIEANGQILLNYRASKKIAQEVTLTELLAGQVSANAIKDRIVLIGVTARGDSPDTWPTPYGTVFDEQMPGVMVHAHMISQILSAVLDQRPLLRLWSPWVEVIWIWIWSLAGVLLVWRWRSFPQVALVVGVTSGVQYLLCLSLLIWGTWVPYVPSALSFLGTVGLISIKNSKFKN